MTFVKICGIAEEAALEAALDAGVDAVGFVFAPASRRYVTPERAHRLSRAVQGRAMTVGVFVASDVGMVRQVAAEVGLEAVQWSGGTVPAEALSAMPDMKHIAVLHLASGDGFPETAPGPYAFLADAHGAPGGTGRLGNWEAAREGATRCRLILAGGLTPGNVGRAVDAVHPFGVDVSSGVETDGRKDPRKVKDFVEAVRAHGA